jgi:CDP-4-dehydro-6-deoxyglucose reductase
MSTDTSAAPQRHEVTLTPSGRTFTAAAGQTVLGAAIAAGVPIPYSCKNGMCRTCLGRVASGAIDPGDVSPETLGRDERQQGYALLCQARPLSDCTIEVTLAATTAPLPQVFPARVARLEIINDIAVVALRLPMNKSLRFEAGQYIDILLDGAQRRSYSIASTPAPAGVGEIELHIRHLPGGRFTDRLFGTMKVGDLLRLEAPLGTFVLRPGAGPAIFLAGSTGFAPVQAMVEDAIARGLHRQRRCHVYWGVRRHADFYRSERLRGWTQRHPELRVVPVVQEAHGQWSGRTGLPHAAVLDDFDDLSSAQVYACGPPAMVDAARRDFISLRGVPPDAFFSDAFLSQADRPRHVALSAEET